MDTSRVETLPAGPPDRGGRTGQRTRVEKGFAVAVSVMLCGATLSPVAENWREKPRDDFPLSYYPMFSATRADAARVTYLVGLDANGTRHTIPYGYAGAGGFNQARKQIDRRAKGGDAGRLAEEVAGRLADKGRGRLAGVTEVRVVTGTYSLREYFAGNKTPVKEKVHAVRPVPRREP